MPNIPPPPHPMNPEQYRAYEQAVQSGADPQTAAREISNLPPERLSERVQAPTPAPPPKQETIKLQTGEEFPKDKYDALPPDARMVLWHSGTKAYNAWLEKGTVVTPQGERVGITVGYEKEGPDKGKPIQITPAEKKILTTKGLEKYNEYIDAETAPIESQTGEKIPRHVWQALPQPMKDLAITKGMEAVRNAYKTSYRDKVVLPNKEVVSGKWLSELSPVELAILYDDGTKGLAKWHENYQKSLVTLPGGDKVPKPWLDSLPPVLRNIAGNDGLKAVAKYQEVFDRTHTKLPDGMYIRNDDLNKLDPAMKKAALSGGIAALDKMAGQVKAREVGKDAISPGIRKQLDDMLNPKPEYSEEYTTPQGQIMRYYPGKGWMKFIPGEMIVPNQMVDGKKVTLEFMKWLGDELEARRTTVLSNTWAFYEGYGWDRLNVDIKTGRIILRDPGRGLPKAILPPGEIPESGIGAPSKDAIKYIKSMEDIGRKWDIKFTKNELAESVKADPSGKFLMPGDGYMSGGYERRSDYWDLVKQPGGGQVVKETTPDTGKAGTVPAKAVVTAEAPRPPEDVTLEPEYEGFEPQRNYNIVGASLDKNEVLVKDNLTGKQKWIEVSEDEARKAKEFVKEKDKFEDELERADPKLFKVYVEGGVNAYNAEVDRLQQVFEAEHIKLKDGLWVKIDDWNQIPEKYRDIGVREGFTAMDDIIKAEQRRYNTVLDSLEKYKTDDGYNVKAAVEDGKGAEIAFIYGDKGAKVVYDVLQQAKAEKELEPYKDKTFAPAGGGYDIAKYLRDNPAGDSMLMAAGFEAKDIQEARDFNRQYLGIGAKEYIPLKEFTRKYFEDKGWPVVESRGQVKTEEDIKRLNEAELAHSQLYAAPMSFDTFKDRYFEDKGWNTSINRATATRAELVEFDKRSEAASNAYDKTYGPGATVKSGAGRAAEFGVGMIPVYGTIRNWNKVDTVGKTIYVLADLLTARTFISGIAAGVRAGLPKSVAAKQSVIAELKAPMTSITRPVETAEGVIYPVKDALSPRAIPIGALEIRESTVRLPLAELQTGKKEAIVLRDVTTSKEIAGLKPVGTAGATRVELNPATLNKVASPAAVHSTPDIRPFLEGASIQAGREGGLFVSPNLHTRFTRASAFGDIPEGNIPGALIIRDEKILAQLQPTGKIYRSTAEIESRIPAGIELPPPSQTLYTRDAGGQRLTLLVFGEPLTAKQVAQLKIIGAADTVKNIFVAPYAVAKTNYERFAQIRNEVNVLEQAASEAKLAGNTKKATELTKQAAELQVVVDREAVRITRDLAGRTNIRPVGLYVGYDWPLEMPARGRTAKTEKADMSLESARPEFDTRLGSTSPARAKARRAEAEVTERRQRETTRQTQQQQSIERAIAEGEEPQYVATPRGKAKKLTTTRAARIEPVPQREIPRVLRLPEPPRAPVSVIRAPDNVLRIEPLPERAAPAARTIPEAARTPEISRGKPQPERAVPPTRETPVPERLKPPARAPLPPPSRTPPPAGKVPLPVRVPVKAEPVKPIRALPVKVKPYSPATRAQGIRPPARIEPLPRAPMERPTKGTPKAKPSDSQVKRRQPTPEELKGAVGWRQGFGTWVMLSPYRGRVDMIFYSGEPPPEVQRVGDSKSAYTTIQTITGKPPPKVDFALGFQKVTVSRPTRQPGTKGTIAFKQIKAKTGSGRPGLNIKRHGRLLKIKGVGLARNKPRGRIL